jgi:putative hydrolase of the HAD superfamily
LCGRFDAVVFSYQLGVRKPDARIYRRALEEIGVAPGEAIFVGDGGSDEHRGAQALGIATVLVTRLYALWWPEQIAARRGQTDWEFDDVPAFVAALGL